MFLINIAYLFFHLLSSASFIFLWGVFIDNDISVITTIEIVIIYLVGWILGFASVGSPAGIGIRESVYLLLLQSMVAHEGLLLAFLLLTRISSTLGEVILYLAPIDMLYGDN